MLKLSQLSQYEFSKLRKAPREILESTCDYVHLNAAFVWLLICSLDVTFNNERDIEKKTGFSLSR